VVPSRSRRGRPIRAYLVGLVLVFAVFAAAGAFYERRTATHDAVQGGVQDASFGARLAAGEVQSDVSALQATVSRLAATPGIAQVFATPAGCTLELADIGAFRTGHLDIVAADGSPVCSSLPRPRPRAYAGARWLAAAARGPFLGAPVADARTGRQVLLATAPIGRHGVVLGAADLDSLGPGLAARLGGPRGLEFVVLSRDRRTVLARSIAPDRWAGAPLPAGARVGGEPSGLDLDGTVRLYGAATVPGVGWTVYAGADRRQALAASDRLSRRELSITVAGLLVMLAAAFTLSRRIVRPIRQLSAGVRAATAHAAPEPVAASGPAEVASLADDFRTLVASANRELSAASQLAAIVESSTDAMIGRTLDGQITSWNAGAERMYGYPADEAIGANVAMLEAPEKAGTLEPLLARVTAGERVEAVETRHVRKDGSALDVSVAAAPIRDASGRVVGACAVIRDITDRNRAEAERQTLEHRLNQSQRLESLGQLAGGVAHDFNNLLGVILNYASFVAERADDGAVRSDVEQIQQAAERAARLTRQLLIVGRRERVRAEILDLNAVVADLRTLLARTIGEHVELVVDAAPRELPILADRGQLEQVLLNLAVNARDAMPDGGTLTIETGPAVLDEEYCRLHPDASPGTYAALSISDTGVGMSPQVAAKVFEPFFTTKPKGQGTGLGLATVYGIVTDAGGALNIYSEEGVGTTLRAYLPLTGDSVPAPTAAVPAEVPSGQGETVLLVEDEDAIREVTMRMLSRNGYTVLAAAAGIEAVSLAVEHGCDLLLTDVVMPQMSGRELAETVRRFRPDLRVLYMSGYSAGVLGPQRVLDDGVALIQKPFDEPTLLRQVHAVLTGPPPGEPAPGEPAPRPASLTAPSRRTGHGP
jgi:PAS domain S-box-containing protein